MDIKIELGKENHIDELEKLYDKINDYLEENINYAGWKKGVYPIREDAKNGVHTKTLYVAKHEGKVVGSIILNNKPEEAYHEATWAFESDYTDVVVVHTFVVHPDYLKCGVGKKLMNYAQTHGVSLGAKAIRLDTYEKNLPAIKLYEKCGYKYIDKVDLGFREFGLEWYYLFEKLL